MVTGGRGHILRWRERVLEAIDSHRELGCCSRLTYRVFRCWRRTAKVPCVGVHLEVVGGLACDNDNDDDDHHTDCGQDPEAQQATFAEAAFLLGGWWRSHWHRWW